MAIGNIIIGDEHKGYMMIELEKRVNEMPFATSTTGRNLVVTTVLKDVLQIVNMQISFGAILENPLHVAASDNQNIVR